MKRSNIGKKTPFCLAVAIFLLALPAFATHNPSVSHSANSVTNGTFLDNYSYNGTVNFTNNVTFGNSILVDPLGLRVGIGTAAPEDKFVVNGSIRTEGATVDISGSFGSIDYYSGGLRLLSFGTGASTRGNITFYQAGSDNSNNQVPLFIDTSGRVGINNTAPNSTLHVIGTGTGGGLRVTNQSNGAEVFFVNSTTGQVGIGTAGPGYKLEVRDDTDTALNPITFRSVFGSGGKKSISWRDNDNIIGAIATEYTIASNTIDFTVHSLYNAGYNTAEVFRIKGNGNVGIGTSGPTDNLHINSSTDTQIIVEGSGARTDANTPRGLLSFIRRIPSGTGVADNDLAGDILTQSTDDAGTVNDIVEVQYLTSDVSAGSVVSDVVWKTVQSSAIGTLTEAMRIRGGRVGIGTTTPANTLVVNGTGATGGFRVVNQSNSYEAFFVNSTLGRIGIGTVSPRQTLVVVGDTNVTGTLYVGSQSFTNIDASGNLIVGDAARVGGSLNVTGNLSINGTLWQPVYPTDDGLVGSWSFSEGTGTTTYDRSPYGNDGTLTNATAATCVAASACPNWTSGKYGNALQFDGLGDYVDAGTDSSLGFTTENFSIEAWINPTTTDHQGIFSKYTTGGSAGYMFWLYSGGYLFMNTGPDAGQTYSDVSIVANQWQHVAVVRDGTSDKFYVNGVQRPTSITTAHTNIAASTISARIGVRSQANNNPFGGKIDEVRVYNRPLADDEIKTQYLRGTQAHGVAVADKFRVVNTTASELLRVTNDGKIGIGTASPTSTLQVTGSANVLALNVNNTLYVNTTTSSVGIGTTAPASGIKLEVSTTGQTLLNIAGDSDNSGSDGSYTGMTVYDQGSEIWFIGRDGTTPSDNLIFRRGGSSNDMVINTAGSVGIGTTSPRNLLELSSTSPKLLVNDTDSIDNVGLLEVSGNQGENIRLGTNSILVTRGPTTSSSLVIGINSSNGAAFTGAGGNILFYTNSRGTYDERVRINASGSVGINDTTPDGIFDIDTGGSTNSFVVANTGSVGIGTSTPANTLVVNGTGATGGFRVVNQSNSYEAFFVNSTIGRVGIGTTAPFAKLHVLGNATIEGNVSINGTLWQPVYPSDDGLVLYLPFSEGNASGGMNVTYDRSPYGNDGTLTNMNTTGNNMMGGSASGWTTGKYGNALGFDAVNDYVDVGRANSLLITGDLSLEVWIKPAAYTSPNSMVVRQGNAGGYTGVYTLLLDSTGTLSLYRGNGVDAQQAVSTTTILPLNVWTHLAVTVSGVTVKFYFNGVLDKTGDHGAVTVADAGTNIVLGRESTASASHYNGSIDEVKLYNRVLSPDEIRTSYLRGSGFGASGAITADKFRVVNTTGTSLLFVNGTNGRVGIGNTAPNSTLHVVGTGATGGFRVVNQSNSYEAFFVNSTLGAVGIGTTTPGQKLEVVGTTAFIKINSTATSGNKGVGLYLTQDTGNKWGIGADFGSASGTPNLEFYSYGTSSVVLTINQTTGSVGIGTTAPAGLLHLNSSSGAGVLRVENTTGASLLFVNGSSSRVGIGKATLENWGAGFTIVELGADASIVATTAAGGANQLVLFQNAYWDGSNYRYQDTGPATQFQSENGDFLFKQAASGTADNTFGWTTNMIVKNAGSVGIGTASPTAKLSVMGNATFNDSVTITNGTLWQPVYPSDDGLVLYLPFSEGNASGGANITYDRSPYGNDGTLYDMNTTGNNMMNGTASGWTTGKYGNALGFDGVGDYVNITRDSSIEPANAITLEMWVKPSTTNNGGLIDKAKTDHTDPYFSWDIEITDAKFVFYLSTGGARTGVTSASSVSAGVWTHVAATYDGSNMRIFLNGVQDVSGSKTGSITYYATNLVIGILRNVPSYKFNGTIDEVRIYNRALSADEIRTQYLRGTQAHGAVTADKFRVVNTTGSANFYVSPTGQVGIGTASPTATLHIGTGSIKFPDGSTLSTAPNFTNFTATGTWTKPTGVKAVIVECFGGGGGGGSGGGQGSNERYGGAGGGGGARKYQVFDAAQLGATETVTIGAGGAGGTGASGNGNVGTPGGNSSFGSWLKAYGGGAGSVAAGSGSGGGGGGSVSAGVIGTAGAPKLASVTGSDNIAGGGGSGGTGDAVGGLAEWGGAGGAGYNTAVTFGSAGGSSVFAGGGGGGGGSVTVGNVEKAGGAGGASNSYTTGGGGTAGAVDGGAGGNGANSATAGGGAGGGGGGGQDSGTGGAGGAGGIPGGGGGGGGGGTSTGGSGGNGARGECKVWSY